MLGICMGALALSLVAGAAGGVAAPRTERMGALSATWAPVGLPAGVRAYLTPIGLSPSEEARLVEARRTGGIDPFAPGHPLPYGRYRAHLVGFSAFAGHRVVIGQAEVLVDSPVSYRLSASLDPRASGHLRIGWSSASFGDGMPPEAPVAPPPVSKPSPILTPKDGAEMVEIVMVQSRVQPVVLAWISPDCGLCRSLHPTLTRAGQNARGWTLVTGDALALEKGLSAKHLKDGGPFVTDRYPTVRRFERGQMISEASDPIVDYWIEKKDDRDIARWAKHDVSIVDVQRGKA